MGDLRCCPYYYYEDYFKKYNCEVIDLSGINKVNKDDFLIIGGGGLFNLNESWNGFINLGIEKTSNVIIWGAGFNMYNTTIDFPEIKLQKSMLLGIRDYKHPYYKFLPCVSCKSRYFDKEFQIKRTIGIVKHYLYKIDLDNSLNGFDCIYNDYWIEDIINFIGQSEFVLSDSYHVLYWATLLNKKVGRLNDYYNSRFRDCMYEYPIVNDISKLKYCKSQSLSNNDLQYFRKLNDSFFEKAKKLIENC